VMFFMPDFYNLLNQLLSHTFSAFMNIEDESTNQNIEEERITREEGESENTESCQNIKKKSRIDTKEQFNNEELWSRLVQEGYMQHGESIGRRTEELITRKQTMQHSLIAKLNSLASRGIDPTIWGDKGEMCESIIGGGEININREITITREFNGGDIMGGRGGDVSSNGPIFICGTCERDYKQEEFKEEQEFNERF